MAHVGERIRLARLVANMSISELAGRCQVPKKVLIDWESGASNPHSEDDLPMVANQAGCDIHWLTEDLIGKPVAARPAPDFLNAAAKHMANRAEQRDTSGGERSMAKTINAFNAIHNTDLTEEQGWMFMVLLKSARASHGIYVQDDYEDGAAYFALAGESASRKRK